MKRQIRAEKSYPTLRESLNSYDLTAGVGHVTTADREFLLAAGAGDDDTD